LHVHCTAIMSCLESPPCLVKCRRRLRSNATSVKTSNHTPPPNDLSEMGDMLGSQPCSPNLPPKKVILTTIVAPNRINQVPLRRCPPTIPSRHGRHVELPKHRDAPLHIDDAQLLRSRHDDRGSDPGANGEVMGAMVMFVEVGWFYMFVCYFFVVFFSSGI
jgi:hypothetical protein